MRLRPRAPALAALLLPVIVPGVGAASTPSPPPAPPGPYQHLTFGTWTAGVVESGSWVDYYVVAGSDDNSIEFEVVAESSSPAALSIYVNDADGGDPYGQPVTITSGQPILDSRVDLHAAEQDRRDGVSAAALDADWVSRIGNETHRHFYAYVSQCYVMKGSYYFLSVYGATWSNVAFQVRATSTSAELRLGQTSGRVCDGKYAHMFFDLVNHPSHGGMSFAVEKRSGALDEWYLRYERCGGPTGNLYTGNLFGHGLTASSRVLPQGDTSLDAGRYYVSVRSSLDLCGEFVVTLTNLTSSALAEASDEV